MHHCDLRLPLKKINLMYSTALFLKNISPPNGGFYVIVRVELEGDGEMYFGYILLNLEISRSARTRTFSACVEYPANIGERYQATTQRSRCPKKGTIRIPVSCRDISKPMEPAAPVIKIRLPRSMLPMASISTSILSLGRRSTKPE